MHKKIGTITTVAIVCILICMGLGVWYGLNSNKGSDKSEQFATNTGAPVDIDPERTHEPVVKPDLQISHPAQRIVVSRTVHHRGTAATTGIYMVRQ